MRQLRLEVLEADIAKDIADVAQLTKELQVMMLTSRRGLETKSRIEGSRD